jgi:hypothetical protein
MTPAPTRQEPPRQAPRQEHANMARDDQGAPKPGALTPASPPAADPSALVERVVLNHDLARLPPADRILYYRSVCSSLGLNPLTWPFRYLYLDGQLRLYITRDGCDQLRTLKQVRIGKPTVELLDDGNLLVVHVEASLPDGRTDADLGVVSLAGVSGVQRANAWMRAVTKAKRRVTLSLVGLGMPDESEIEDIPGAQRITVTDDGEIVPPVAQQEEAPPAPAPGAAPGQLSEAEERAALVRALTALLARHIPDTGKRLRVLETWFGADADLDRVDLAQLADVYRRASSDTKWLRQQAEVNP